MTDAATTAVDSLGRLLRTWRERLHPEDAGIVSSGARRAKGLRREELAQLAGLSVDYLTRLEQGRASSPSPQVVAALARALQLSRTESGLLHRMAGLLPPVRGRVDDHVPPGIQRMIARMGDQVLAVFAADWTLLQATPLWERLLGPLVDETGQPLNVARSMFLGGRSSPATTREEDTAVLREALVADLRRSAVEYGEDPRFQELIGVLQGDERFRELWATGHAAVHRSMSKRIVHDEVGEMELDCDVLTVPDSDVKLMIYSAPTGSRGAEALETLRARRLEDLRRQDALSPPS